jgi:Family of unknown function (DUF6174)
MGSPAGGLRLNSNNMLRQNDSHEEEDIISHLTLEVLDDVHNRNPQRHLLDEDVFTFPLEPVGGPSCQGRQAKTMRQRYERKLARWERFHPTCYTFTLEQVCFKCLDYQPIQVTVVNGNITATEPVAEEGREIPTMMDLFDHLRNCISDCEDGNMHQCKVKYFSKVGGNGAIEGLYTDGDASPVDEEYYAYYVRDFQTC